MMFKIVASAVVLSSLFFYNEVGGGRLSEKDKLEIKKQLKTFRKSAVKTIRTDYGAIYDCIDFYQQPAFDHPLLKNHSFHPQMRPSFTPKWTKSKVSSAKIQTKILSLKDGGCPQGTVPIRRVTKNDLIRIKYLTKEYASGLKPNGSQPNGVTHVAIVRTSSIPYSRKTYKGVGATLNVYNLPIGKSQYTIGAITLRNGMDIIQVGWMVNPTLHKDNRTHGFGFLNAGKSQCFNTLCPGFISIRTDFPIDGTFEGTVSVRGGVPMVGDWLIYQDIYSGNWWLAVGQNATLIGFWPKKIFTSLAEYGSSIACGGQVYSPFGQPDPLMGSGFRPKMDTRYDAYCADFIVQNKGHETEPAMDVEEYSNSNMYKVKDWGIVKQMGHLVVYGGPNKP